MTDDEEQTTDTSRLRDTYAAALQHDLVDLTGEERLVGVVRRPLPWLLGQVDENRPALGPPPDLLEEFKERHEELQEAGMGDAEAHNTALEEIDYRRRYRSYLAESDDARAAIEDIRDLLAAGRDVVLVCYENTDEKWCHRTLLKRIVRDGRA